MKIKELIDLVMEEPIITDGPLNGRVHVEWEGHPATLIIGENGAGKSLLRKLIGQVAKNHDIEAMPLSMSGRTQGGVVSSLIYGNEMNHSTGDLSLRVLKTARSTSDLRTNDHLLLFDEPDIGASAKLAATMGRILGEWLDEGTSDKLVHVFVTTHSKPLVRQLMKHSGINTIFVGEKPLSVKEWLDDEEEAMTSSEVEAFRDKNLEFFRKVQKWIDGVNCR